MDKKIACCYLENQEDRETIIISILSYFKPQKLWFYNTTLALLNGLSYDLLKVIRLEIKNLLGFSNVEKLKRLLDFVEKRIGE